jgi:hypothetical protein
MFHERSAQLAPPVEPYGLEDHGRMRKELTLLYLFLVQTTFFFLNSDVCDFSPFEQFPLSSVSRFFDASYTYPVIAVSGMIKQLTRVCLRLSAPLSSWRIPRMSGNRSSELASWRINNTRKGSALSGARHLMHVEE